jgi:hypothetical protein
VSLAHSLACSCLDCLIRRLRDELRAETPMRVTARAVPVLRDHEGIPTKKDADEGGLGPPLTAAMWRYLGGPDYWGTSRMGMSSIIEVSEYCAPRHPTHRRAMFERTVCGQLAFEAGRLNQDLEDLAWLHREPTPGMPALSKEQIEGLLTAALRHAETWRVERFMRLTREPGHVAPSPERKRVA